MAFGSFSPGMMPAASPAASPGVGDMGMRILQMAMQNRGKPGAPPSLLPQVFGQQPAPTAGGAAPAGPGMLQGLMAKLGIGGQPGAPPTPPMGVPGFAANAQAQMRDPNAMMTGDAPAMGGGPGPTALTGLW